MTPGGVVTVLTGTDYTFTTTVTDLATAEITLEVTDSNGSTASLTEAISLGSVPVNSRKIYACTDTTYEAFDGAQWRSAAPSGGGSVQVVAAGPWWGAQNKVAYSADDLATAPTEAVAFPDGQDITAIWKHESDENFIVVGGAEGGVATSTDKGTTWAVQTPPGTSVKFIISSIFNKDELHAMTPDGWFKSPDGGSSWELVRAGDFIYIELSHSRNIVITGDGQLQKAEDGTPFTGPTAAIVAATAHIRQDKFYAIAEDGTTWIQETEGSFEMVAGEPIPAGDPYPAGTYRDGLIVDLVYFAAQEGGLFKTLDGFRTAEGYMRLRADGEITP